MQNGKSNIHINHRNRLKNKFKEHGFSGLAEHEVVELLLFYAIKRKDVNPIAHALISRFKNIEGILCAPKGELIKVDGIGERSADLIIACGKIIEDYLQNKVKSRQIISTALAKGFAYDNIELKPIEETYLICLDGFLNVIAIKLLEVGERTKVKLDINKITQFAFGANASKAILIHTHPSGNPLPSEDDIVFTHSVATSCLFNDIDLLDHIILAKDCAFSFVENNLLATIKFSEYKTIPGAEPLKDINDFISTAYINSKQGRF